MLERILNIVCTTAFACLVLGFVFVDWRISSLPPANQHAKAQAADGARSGAPALTASKSAEERIADYTWWLSAFTLALTVVSAFQIFFLIRADNIARISAQAAKKSADAARDAVQLADRTAERQLRAYLGVKEANVKSDDGGNTFFVQITIINSGQTPARQVTHRIGAALEDRQGTSLLFEMPERISGEWVMVPGAAFDLKCNIAIGGPTGATTISIGQRSIFAWGRVDYIDVFDGHQHIEFRYRSAGYVRKHDGTVMRTVGWEMDPENEGNTAT